MADIFSQYSFGQTPAVNLYGGTASNPPLQTSSGQGLFGQPQVDPWAALDAQLTPQGGSGSTGQVLGTSTTNTGDGLPNPDQSGQINSGWDSYTNQLNDLLNNNLPQQKQTQEQSVQNTYNTGVNQLGQQKTTAEQDVAKQQATNLKDLSANIRNLFNSGNTYLGARGASDSSAANQYSYALSKLGTKGRSDIMSQASDRLSQIGDIYNSEVNRLESEKSSALTSISQWFSEQQANLKQQLGQAGLGRSQDLQAASQNLYNIALQNLQNVQAELSNRRSSLEQWALNNSKSVQEAIANVKSLQSLPEFQGINGGMPQITSNGQQYLPTGYGSTGSSNTDIFGNPIG